jgi:hypothetical protein
VTLFTTSVALSASVSFPRTLIVTAVNWFVVAVSLTATVGLSFILETAMTVFRVLLAGLVSASPPVNVAVAVRV